MLKKLLFAFLLISITSVTAYSSTPSPDASDIIIIRVYHPVSNLSTGLIKIYRNSEVPLQIVIPAQNEQDDNNSFQLIRDTLNKYTLEGYSIVTSTESIQVQRIYTTYVLEKK